MTQLSSSCVLVAKQNSRYEKHYHHEQAQQQRSERHNITTHNGINERTKDDHEQAQQQRSEHDRLPSTRGSFPIWRGGTASSPGEASA